MLVYSKYSKLLDSVVSLRHAFTTRGKENKSLCILRFKAARVLKPISFNSSYCPKSRKIKWNSTFQENTKILKIINIVSCIWLSIFYYHLFTFYRYEMPSYMWGTVLSSSSSKRLQHGKQNFHFIFWFIKRKRNC